MREILFKAKRKDNGEWVEGGVLHQTDYYGDKVDKYFIIDGTCTVDYDIGEVFEVDKNTVCQYTGLKDKNGKEIYEGDIFKFNDETWGNFITNNRITFEEWKIENFGVINFDETHGKYVFSKTKYINSSVVEDLYCNTYELADFVQDLEVIGNIFDNPELLEKTDKQAGEYADNEVLKPAT